MTITVTVKPYPGMILTENVRFEPGEYDFEGGQGIVVAAHGITIDGNGAVIRGKGTPGRIHSFAGTGLYANGYDGVTVKGLSLHGFKTGMKVVNGSGWTIEGNDLSDNYSDPDYGWGDGEPYGALFLERVSDSLITGNAGNRVWNGLHLRYADRNRVAGNTFSHCTNVCLKLWNASENDIDGNVFSHGIRIAPGEVHARDSTSALIESGSNRNRIVRNDFTHGGDGVFVRSLNGFVSTGNHFEGNDASYAHNNAWEVWDPDNVFVRNRGNHSSYGFWLGGSCHAVLIENEAAYNGLEKRNAPEPFGNAGIAVVNGSSSHITMRGNRIHHNKSVGLAIGFKEGYEAAHWIVEHNEIADNDTYGVYMKHAKQLYFAGNRMSGNGAGDWFEDANVTEITVREASGPSPTARAALLTARPIAGQAVLLDASASAPAAEGETLIFLWDLGDGTRSDSSSPRHRYESPGFYRVGLTVFGERGTADLDWIDLHALHADEQVKHRFPIQEAVLAESRPALATAIEPEPGGGVQGGTALKLSSSASLVKLRYGLPPALASAIASGEAGELSFWIRFAHEAWGGFASSALTVRLLRDERRYMQWTSAKPFLDWTRIASEARCGWSNIRIPLAGETSDWALGAAGHPDRNGFLFLEIQIDSCGGSFTLRLDEIVLV